MLLLPAAALCCLCSALVTMAAELIQDQLSLTKSVGGTASFSCGGTDQCYSYVFWYQKKDKETFRIILHVDPSSCSIESGYGHPQINDFTAEKKHNSCELKIKKVKSVHSATYYCVCWKKTDKWSFIFGSGTKLFVTGEPVVKPVLSVYPAASRALDGKSVLLCVASNMSPPLVHFSWKRQKEGGPLEDLTSAQGEQLKLRVSERTTAIMVVDRDASYTYKYRCNVRHEGGPVDAPAEQEVPALPSTTPPSTTPPSTTPPSTTPPSKTLPSTTPPSTTPPSTTPPSTTPPSKTLPSTTPPSKTLPSTTPPSKTLPSTTPPSTTPPSTTPPSKTPPATTPPSKTLPSTTPPATTPPSKTLPSTTPPSKTLPSKTPPAPTWSQQQLKLLCLLYTVLMVKSLVYCCGLSLINILRNRERPPAAHKTPELPPAASPSH